MFRIKICGVTRPADARAIAAAGADAIGLNFYAKSPRFVTVEQARAIAAELPVGRSKIGVFVNSTPAEIRSIAESVPLSMIQLHGDEPPAVLADLAPWRIIRAWRAASDQWGRLTEYLNECRRLNALPEALLIDAHQIGAYGGTGQQVDWSELAARRELLQGIPLILAGGLRPDNVTEAIRTVQPHGVDTASGVESRPGQKETQLVRDFVTAARAGWARLIKYPHLENALGAIFSIEMGLSGEAQQAMLRRALVNETWRTEFQQQLLAALADKETSWMELLANDRYEAADAKTEAEAREIAVSLFWSTTFPGEAVP